MKDLIYHFFPTKAIQSQKRYIRRGIYRRRDTNIRYLICRIDEMVEYLKKSPPFEAGQCLPDNEILDIVDFSLKRI